MIRSKKKLKTQKPKMRYCGGSKKRASVSDLMSGLVCLSDPAVYYGVQLAKGLLQDSQKTRDDRIR